MNGSMNYGSLMNTEPQSCSFAQHRMTASVSGIQVKRKLVFVRMEVALFVLEQMVVCMCTLTKLHFSSCSGQPSEAAPEEVRCGG